MCPEKTGGDHSPVMGPESGDHRWEARYACFLTQWQVPQACPQSLDPKRDPLCSLPQHATSFTARSLFALMPDLLTSPLVCVLPDCSQ